jgi:hypothetical protein
MDKTLLSSFNQTLKLEKEKRIGNAIKRRSQRQVEWHQDE